MTLEEFSGGQPIKPVGMSFEQFSGGQPLTVDKNASLLGMTTSAHERLAKAQEDSAKAQQTAKDANSSTGIAKETFKESARTLLEPAAKFVKSAVRAPIDIVRGFFGKDPLVIKGVDDRPGESTIQQDFAKNAIKVGNNEMSPLAATSQAVGDVVSGAGDVLGVGALAEKGAGMIAKTTAKQAEKLATERAIRRSPNYLKDIAEDTEMFGGPPPEMPSSVKKATKSIQATEDTMTKGERMQAIDEGRLKPTKLGGKIYTPSETEQRAGQILEGNLSGNPIKDVGAVKSEISSRGAEAEQYLAKESKPITNKEHYDMFADKRTEATKHLTDTELKAYDEQVKMFSKQLPGRGGYNTENYYKALKDYEQNVADKLPRGKEALLDPTGIANAKIRAASDVRGVVRDMIGSKNPEFKGRMFDLASLYEVKGNLMSKAEQLEGNAITRFVKKPIVKVATGTAVGVEGARKILTGKF